MWIIHLDSYTSIFCYVWVAREIIHRVCVVWDIRVQKEQGLTRHKPMAHPVVSRYFLLHRARLSKYYIVEGTYMESSFK